MVFFLRSVKLCYPMLKGNQQRTNNSSLILDTDSSVLSVVYMQETHRGPDDIRPSIPVMDLAIERLHSRYGSAIFVTSGTIVNTISLTYINNIEIMIVDLNGISVTSFYKPPGEQSSFDHPHITSCHQPQVIIGDFNSHSSQWGYATTKLMVNW